MSLGLNENEPYSGEPDALVLEEFVRTSNEKAFCELLRRHATMVQASALRICGNRAVAEEVAQATLLVLAKKAGRIKIPEHGTLGPWLHRVAVLEARNACKKEQRRRRAIQKMSEKIKVDTTETSDDPIWRSALPHLDGAINALPEGDRRVIVMRFMEEQPYGEMGSALGGLSADAARMKTKRAVAKLSEVLKRRGALVPAALLATGLSGLATPKLSAATAVQRSSELLSLASSASAPASLSFASVILAGWGGRIAAFLVGLGVPVLHSAHEERSNSIPTAKRLSSEDAEAQDTRVLPSALSRSGVGDSPSPLNRLLEQIAQLENEFEAPAMLSETMEAIMALELDQLPLVWETAWSEQPPQVVLDAIIMRWAELDPVDALAVCFELEDGMKQGSLAIKVWYQTDPPRATEHFRELPPEFFTNGGKHFWQTIALTDPGLGLQVSLEVGGTELLPQIYRYTLLQGWFRAQGLEFPTTHLDERPGKYLQSHTRILEEIRPLPPLNAEQLTGAFMWVAGVPNIENRSTYVDLLMSKFDPATGTELFDWVSESPLISEDLRANLLDHPNLKLR